MSRVRIPSPRALVVWATDLLRGSYWAIPAGLSVAAVLLAQLSIHFDHAFDFADGPLEAWLYSGTAEGARTVLSALSGSLITVCSVVFSITIVALSFASSQIGPRLLRNFMRDRVNQSVLGVFVATYLYSLTVLSSLRGGEDSRFVPELSISLGLVLAMLSFGLLIFFVHHVATTIQVGSAVENVRRSLQRTVDGLLEEGDAPARRRADSLRTLPVSFDHVAVTTGSGYLQVIDFEGLVELACEHGIRIACTRRPGHYLVPGGELFRSDRPPSADLLDKLRSAFVLGHVRTEVQDLEFPIRQLVEVALRALSPGVNDPFTAITCIDHLSSCFAHMSCKAMPGVREHRPPSREAGGAHARHASPAPVLSIAIRFSEAMDTAWNPLRQHGAGQVAVAIRILEALTRIAEVTGDEHCLVSVLEHARKTARAALRDCVEPRDRGDLSERARQVFSVCEERLARVADHALARPDARASRLHHGALGSAR